MKLELLHRVRHSRVLRRGHGRWDPLQGGVDDVNDAVALMNAHELERSLAVIEEKRTSVSAQWSALPGQLAFTW
jgi:hypothetical protein